MIFMNGFQKKTLPVISSKNPIKNPVKKPIYFNSALIIFFFLAMIYNHHLLGAQQNLPTDVNQDARPHTYILHNLSVSIDPQNAFIRVSDSISIPISMMNHSSDIHFLLHGNLSISSYSKNCSIRKESNEINPELFGLPSSKSMKFDIPIAHYSIHLSEKSKNSTSSLKDQTVSITYEGKINHPIIQSGSEYARGFSETPGIISNDGVYLAGASYWIPWFNSDLFCFKMNTSLPYPWVSVSQGNRSVHKIKNKTCLSSWDSPEPVDEIYLIAAHFKEYGLKVNNIDVMAFLRSDDEPLANKYLETTGQYLEMYENLIGAYPYSKFALVENFWETGYGMPSFTLLGSKIIRFPFILHSSYPHELLHNWWGNSVFVNYNWGNWSEGLTVYLADFLIKEQRDEGTEYRKTVLQEYSHYAVNKREEFPLSNFKSRYDSLSSSIGYGKSMMMFHSLRLLTGDVLFKKIIRHFYSNNKFKLASFDDLKKSAEFITQKDLNDFFNEWINQKGAPEIQLINPSVIRVENGSSSQFLVHFSLKQIQEPLFKFLNIPIAFTLSNQKDAVIKTVSLSQKEENFSFSFDSLPTWMDVDPQFDVFRKLHSNEIPPTLSNAFGSKDILILLPSKAEQNFLNEYRSLAVSWAKENDANIDIKLDNEFLSLPADKAIWLLGWENLHRNAIQKNIASLEKDIPGTLMDDSSVTLDQKKLTPNTSSLVVAVKNENNPDNVIILLSTDQSAALPGLGRKLPHYGKYSYLAFEGSEPVNTLKGQWPVVNSPLSTKLTLNNSLVSSSFRGTLPKREPLALLSPSFSAKRMMDHINMLCSTEMQGRGLGSEGLLKASDYIAQSFQNAGLMPGGDDHSFFQSWETIGGPDNKKIMLRNVIGIIRGSKPEWKNEWVILCAHYDHLGLGWPDVYKGNQGKIHAGADDNASGVSVMLELAKLLNASVKPERNIVFIAFTGEEDKRLGSSYYIKYLEENDKLRLKHIIGVVNLDSVGRLKDSDKLMVIGDGSAREWKFIFMGIGYTTGIQTECATQAPNGSDQASFIAAGIPAIQLFSGPHNDYHRPSDTPEKIEAGGLVKVASVAKETILYLCERKDPMTPTMNATAAPTSPVPGDDKKPSEIRKASTGLMPDFSFQGNGVKIAAVSPGSPAEKAGLKKDDIIISFGNKNVSSLKEYSDVLKTYNPGDNASIVFLRDDKQFTVSVTLSAR